MYELECPESRRSDVESAHRQLKRSMAKLPAYGTRAQSLYMLGAVIAHNALTRAHILKREGGPNALDGA